MFDTIAGLPVHALVIHAVVVLGPLAGLTAIAYAVRPSWRGVLRVPLAVVAVLAALTATVAVQSGEALEARLTRLGVGGPTLDAIVLHSERGVLARNVALITVVIALGATLWLLRPQVPDENGPVSTPGRPAARMVVAVLLAASGLGLVVTTTLAGHSGSQAVWSDIGSA